MVYTEVMKPKNSQLPDSPMWVRAHNFDTNKMTYNSPTGHVITREPYYTPGRSKDSYHYTIKNKDGSVDGIPKTYHTTLSGAKAHVAEITKDTN
jgi:hypothetical protein